MAARSLCNVRDEFSNAASLHLRANANRFGERVLRSLPGSIGPGRSPPDDVFALRDEPAGAAAILCGAAAGTAAVLRGAATGAAAICSARPAAICLCATG